MTPDIRKQIEAAADAYGDNEINNHPGVDTFESISFTPIALEHAFTAGAEFGYGLASGEVASWKYSYKLLDEHCEALQARVKELEADRSMVTTQLIELRVAADDMARALEYLVETYPSVFTSTGIIQAQQALTNYRKLFGKGEG